MRKKINYTVTQGKIKIDSSTVAKEKRKLLSSNCRADIDAWAHPCITPV